MTRPDLSPPRFHFHTWGRSHRSFVACHEPEPPDVCEKRDRMVPQVAFGIQRTRKQLVAPWVASVVFFLFARIRLNAICIATVFPWSPEGGCMRREEIGLPRWSGGPPLSSVIAVPPQTSVPRRTCERPPRPRSRIRFVGIDVFRDSYDGCCSWDWRPTRTREIGAVVLDFGVFQAASLFASSPASSRIDPRRVPEAASFCDGYNRDHARSRVPKHL